MQDKACIINIQKFSLHDGPGIRSVVFFKGCPLRCSWCSNPESQKLQPEKMWDNSKNDYCIVGKYKTIKEIINEVLQDVAFYEESKGGVTLSGGEVLSQASFAIKLLKELKNYNIHTACETTGFAKSHIFNQFIEDIDLLYFDIKHYNTFKHKEGVKVSNELILDNLKFAFDNHKNLMVRVPIIPSYNDSLEDAKGFAELFNTIGIAKVELLPFHQFGEKKYEYLGKDYKLSNVPQLHAEDLIDYKKVIAEHNINCIVR